MSDQNLAHRCLVCRMLRQLCICNQIPRLEIKTKISILMHGLEEKKITNTARLLKLAAPETDILLFGRLGVQSQIVIPPKVTPLVLYPTDSALTLDSEFCSKLQYPVFLIVPDGTWTQARKLIQRRSDLYQIPRVRINREEPSNYKVRRSRDSKSLCTLEAVAEALGVLEGPEIKQQLDKLLSLMVSRVLLSRTFFYGQSLVD